MDLLKKRDCNTRIAEIESKIPSISCLATNSALTGVENRIPDVNNLVKKTHYNTKVRENEKKFKDHDHDNRRKFCCKIRTSKFSNKDRF